MYRELDIVFITKPVPDYLHDVLYLGLCQLGCNVVDMPRKESLHGTPHFAGFHSDGYCGPAKPLLYSLPRNNLRKQNPDAIILTAQSHDMNAGGALAWINTSCNIIMAMKPRKLIVVDGMDTHLWSYPVLKQPYDKIFKREMTAPYGPQWEAINFAASPESFVFKPFDVRKYDVSFIANFASSAFRPVVASFLREETKRLGMTSYVVEKVRRDGYLDILADSKVSVSVHGAGLQCYRYWEVPAKGVVLLTEDTGAYIHNDFTAEHCFRFKTLEDLSARLVAIKSMTNAQLELMALKALAHSAEFHSPVKLAERVLSCVIR